MEVLLGPYYEEQHVAGMVLETLVEWRPLILAEEELRQLAVAESFTTRSTAASCMYQLAQCAPARVPLELLDTLADPSEDYYVQEPAMAALKYCARTRPAALAYIQQWLQSGDDVMVEHAAGAVRDLALVDPQLVSDEMLEACRTSAVQSAIALGREAQKYLELHGELRRRAGYHPF